MKTLTYVIIWKWKDRKRLYKRENRAEEIVRVGEIEKQKGRMKNRRFCLADVL